jgi:hypothetical protein
VGIGIGVLVTPAALFVALLSAGAGHGHYVFTRALFPYSILLTRPPDHVITYPLVWLGLVQFPIYGAIIGLAASKRLLAYSAAIVIATVHGIAVTKCFSGEFSNFAYNPPPNQSLEATAAAPVTRTVTGNKALSASARPPVHGCASAQLCVRRIAHRDGLCMRRSYRIQCNHPRSSCDSFSMRNLPSRRTKRLDDFSFTKDSMQTIVTGAKTSENGGELDQ